jgi:gluconolactonase
MTDLVNTEGPVWHDGRNALLFSDMQPPLKAQGGRIYEMKVPSLALTALRDPSNNANGLALHPDGSLLIAEQATRRVRKWPFTGHGEVIAAFWGGNALNAPNGIDVRSDGTVYFSDPDFINPLPPLLGFNGLFRIDPQGTLHLEAMMHSPNGLALSPGEDTLYVVNQNLGNVVTFDVATNGALTATGTFVGGLQVPDGVRCDSEGNVFVTVEAEFGGQVRAYAPDGTLWGTVAMPEPARNCNFGMADRKTLFVTAATSIYSIPVAVPGVGGQAPPPPPPPPPPAGVPVSGWTALAIAACIALGARSLLARGSRRA